MNGSRGLTLTDASGVAMRRDGGFEMEVGMTLAEQLAGRICSLSFEALPADVVELMLRPGSWSRPTSGSPRTYGAKGGRGNAPLAAPRP